MLVIRDPQHPHPQQRTVAQVEWPGDLLAGQLLRFDVRRRSMPQVAGLEAQRQLSVHPLPGLAVFFVKGGAQHGMTLHQGFEGSAQGVEVQFAAQAQGTRHVVHRTVRLQVPQEPQALLGKGQRLAFARGIRHQRRALTAVLQRLHPGGEIFKARVFEQAAQTHRKAQALADLRDDLRRQQRVPAQFEEAVFAVDATDLQHLPPDLRQFDFQCALRGAADVGLPDLRGRQRGAVEFAVAVERQRGQQHQLRRQHVLRQALAQGAAYGVGELTRISVQQFI
ncbi:hypothetical protein D3C71_1013160 [compost metagenome]